MTWWRKQRLALAAMILAAGAVIGIHVWLDVLPASTDEDAVTVHAHGDQAAIAGQTLSVDSVLWSEFDAPPGSRTLSVRLDARAGEDPAVCGLFTLAEVRGDRVWSNARTALDVPYEAGASYCQEESGPYVILAIFLLPDDATGPFWLDIPGDDEIARFRVDL